VVLGLVFSFAKRLLMKVGLEWRGIGFSYEIGRALRF
jgi:hypothetical protein